MNRSKFNRIVAKYHGDNYIKHFSYWNQLKVLMFGQLSRRDSLRDLIVAVEAHRGKAKFLGFGDSVTRSNLAKANQNRDYHIFEEFAYYMVEQAPTLRVTKIFNLVGNIYAFDSTTIELCLAVFCWAKFRKKKGGIKVHTLYDIEARVPAFSHITTASVHDSQVMKEIPVETGSYYIFDRGYNFFLQLYRIECAGAFFVVRAKKNLQHKAIRWKRRMPKGVTIIRSSSAESSTTMRNLRRTLFLLNRRSVELFFKWLKQHLKIKKFWGDSSDPRNIAYRYDATSRPL